MEKEIKFQMSRAHFNFTWGLPKKEFIPEIASKLNRPSHLHPPPFGDHDSAADLQGGLTGCRGFRTRESLGGWNLDLLIPPGLVGERWPVGPTAARQVLGDLTNPIIEQPDLCKGSKQMRELLDMGEDGLLGPSGWKRELACSRLMVRRPAVLALTQPILPTRNLSAISFPCQGLI